MKENNNISEKYGRDSSGFQVPEGYFNALEDRLMNNLKKEKKVLPDKLDTGFAVPKGYFEKPVDLQHNNPVRNNRVIKLFSKKVIGLSIAASILIFIGVKTLPTENLSTGFSDFSSEELLSWLETDAADVNSYDIAEVFDNLSLEEEYYTDEALLDYVADSDIEELLIEN